MTIIDTNILYYHYANGNYPTDPTGKYVTSINALEFLRNIEKKHTNRAKYYLPILLSNIDEKAFVANMKDHKTGSKRLTDNILFDFAGEFESYMLYNNLSIANHINSKQNLSFMHCIQGLNKESSKEVRSKFNYLLDRNVKCIQIDEQDIELGYALLAQFKQQHSLKKDFRNSWNDMLILAKSINLGAELISNDKLLNTYRTIFGNHQVDNIDKNINSIKFEPKAAPTKQAEHKGYNNNGWRYQFFRNSNFSQKKF